MSGPANPIYTEVYPDQDFAKSGYWFWLKNKSATGFDVKAFDSVFIYMRATELNWQATSFKRFVHDLPVAFRCVSAGKSGPQIRLLASSSAFTFYSNCTAYKTSNLGAVVNNIDAPACGNGVPTGCFGAFAGGQGRATTLRVRFVGRK